MENNNQDVSFKDLEVFLADELKIYLSLENSVYEFMEAYKNNPNDNLKNVILKVLENAKQQNILLLNLVSNYYKGEEKNKYSNLLGRKLNSLNDVEGELKDLSKSK